MNKKNPDSECCGRIMMKFPILIWDCEYGEKRTGHYFYVCPDCRKPAIAKGGDERGWKK